MIINRHNYEEFFLLYIDNELDASDKTTVENFVNQHPDLAQELEMLQQTTLSNHAIEFAEKELLYRKETGISLANYEEYFLLAADTELNKQQITKVENFVLKHPQLQDEFTLLQQTTLKAPVIVFTGKKNLYRYEKKERRIIPVWWMRMSAAAAFIGIIITAIVFTNNENNNKSTVFTNSTKSVKPYLEKDKTLAQKPVTEKPPASSFVKKEKKNTAIVANKPAKANAVKNKDLKKSEESVAVEKPKIEIKHNPTIKVNNAPLAKAVINEPKNTVPQKIKPSDSNINNDIANNHPADKTIHSLAKESFVDEQPVLASHAVYIQTDNDEEEKTLYIGSAEINKNKLKGLFKKATVFFDKKIRRNDN